MFQDVFQKASSYNRCLGRVASFLLEAVDSPLLVPTTQCRWCSVGWQGDLPRTGGRPRSGHWQCIKVFFGMYWKWCYHISSVWVTLWYLCKNSTVQAIFTIKFLTVAGTSQHDDITSRHMLEMMLPCHRRCNPGLPRASCKSLPTPCHLPGLLGWQ